MANWRTANKRKARNMLRAGPVVRWAVWSHRYEVRGDPVTVRREEDDEIYGKRMRELHGFVTNHYGQSMMVPIVEAWR
ncbi:hypothetical protein [Sphingomonas sanxanigenens]|uniref:Uncharacterized protein n=1 Tax=Sphingomonas sanxanigenens DSM 19645 = NX02 TaxID=1123269 RepID=W0A849_9SPHN|nr:hypothetical protein [Sphingomonas sanxanigenens]AHE52657.1 hypothetical protein NX02_04570 [Sphingomonas sanxanigenens DSM 19645 = NX02]